MSQAKNVELLIVRVYFTRLRCTHTPCLSTWLHLRFSYRMKILSVVVSIVVLFVDEKINFFINSHQRTSRFSVRLSYYFPNPAPQNRQFPSPIHDRNPASRSPLTLNSRPLSKPNPGSRKTYWGPSIYFTKIPIQKLVYFVSIPVAFRFFIRPGFPLMCDFLSVECHFLIFRQLTITSLGIDWEVMICQMQVA